jgi:hypothetical protein
MKKGDISNVPAPLTFVDGASLLNKKFFGYTPNLNWQIVLNKLYKERTLVFWFDSDKKAYNKIDKHSKYLDPFLYNTVVHEPLMKILDKAMKNGTKLLTADELILRRFPFQTMDISLPIQKILEEA